MNMQPMTKEEKEARDLNKRRLFNDIYKRMPDQVVLPVVTPTVAQEQSVTPTVTSKGPGR